MLEIGQVTFAPANINKTSEFMDTGAYVEFELAAESDVFVETVAYRAGSGTSTVLTSIQVDNGADEIKVGKIPASAQGSAVQVYALTLPAGKHKIDLRAKRSEDGNKSAALQDETTRIVAATVPA